ncbi:MAG: 4Fe-4S binding protein [Clostridia bacterium]|nr:4Fe-4S binding protein [Clostridia bacterium]
MGEDNLKIAVLSGKGGTGKTLLSVNLAASAGECTYVDCDVEEPNGHLYFKPKELEKEKITIKIPHVDLEACNGCRECVNFCKFNALAYTNKLLIFEEICHSCGGCVLLCPEKALSEKEKPIGGLEKGKWENVTVLTGILNMGEASGVPIIERLLDLSKSMEGLCFIDCPPGSSCVVMESVRDADYCILVAEPTLFGVHNFEMVYDLVRLFDKPHGAVLNKCMKGENPAEKFCIDKGIKILGRIPFHHELGRLNSEAKIVAQEKKVFGDMFSLLLKTVLGEVCHEAAVNSQR